MTKILQDSKGRGLAGLDSSSDVKFIKSIV